MKKILSFLCVVILITSIAAPPVALATMELSPMSNSYISDFTSNISALGNGKVKIEFTTTGTKSMDTIGASVIKVYDQNGWVYTFDKSNTAYTSKMVGNNTFAFTGSVTYDGQSGDTYYAIVTHYAAKGSGSGTENYTTNSVVA